MGKLIDLTEKDFGDWFVLYNAGVKPVGKKYKHYWMCRCKCGIEREVVGDDLRNKQSTGCGCSKIEKSKTRPKPAGFCTRGNYTNQQIGNLIFRKVSHITKSGNAIWITECVQCGKEIRVEPSVARKKSKYLCKCSGRSTLEQNVFDFAIKYNIPFEEQYYLPQKYFTINESNYNLKVDFLFDYQEIYIAIECQGAHHYKTIKKFGGEKRFEEYKLRDEYKRKILYYQNIPLIEVKYNERDIEEFLLNELPLAIQRIR